MKTLKTTWDKPKKKWGFNVYRMCSPEGEFFGWRQLPNGKRTKAA